MKRVKLGDKFVLGPWKWTVDDMADDQFHASHEHRTSPTHTNIKTIWLFNEDANRLEWIEPEPTISQEAAKKLLEIVNDCLCEEYSCADNMRQQINSMIEKKN